MVWVNDVNVKYALGTTEAKPISDALCIMKFVSWALKGGQHPGTLNSDQAESELAQKVPLFPEWDVYNFCFIFFPNKFQSKTK